MPPRGALDPVVLRTALPHVWICDFEAGTGRFRYRLSGETVNATYGRSLAGSYLDDLFPVEARQRILRRYDLVVREGLLVHTVGWIYEANKRAISGERLVMPLAQDGETLDGVFGITVQADLRGQPLAEAAERAPVEGERVIRRYLRVTAGAAA